MAMLRSPIKSPFLRNRLSDIFLRSSVTTVSQAYSDQTVLPFSKIPRIRSLPLIGSGWAYLPLIGKYNLFKLHHANMQKYREYGPIVYEEMNENLKFVHLFDPGEYSKVYRNEGKYPERIIIQGFRKYRENQKDLYKNGGMLTTNGSEWHEVRSQVQPHMMKPKSVHAYLGAMDSVAQRFTDRMVSIRGKSDLEVPDYMNELYKWALESIGLVALDARLGCIEPVPNKEGEEMIQAVTTIFECLMKLEFGISQLWKKYPSLTYRRFEKNLDILTGAVFRYLREAQERLKNAPEDHEATFLEMMISTTKDPRNLNATIQDMFFGGIDTTSTTVGFTLYHLARNPEAQEKLYREIQATLVDNKITLETINNSKYLKACVKEGMRLNPVAIGNVRRLVNDTVLSGYMVPAGTQVFTQQYVIGQLDKYFPEAKKFKPERFLREGEMSHDPFAFIPFGFGPRSCVGRRIAEQEIWTLLIRLIQRFRVEYHHEEWDMVTRGVAVPDKPLRFQFYDR